MSYIQRLNPSQQRSIYNYLYDYEGIYVLNEENCRRFVEAVFWVTRIGSQWRLLPKEYGAWNTVYRRFSDWAKKGVWYKMLYYFQDDPDMECIMIDSTILRAHACATSKKKTNKPKDQVVVVGDLAPKFMPSVMHQVTH